MRFMGKDWDYSQANDLLCALDACEAYLIGWQTRLGYPAAPETWARLWNGGPRGPEKKATIGYWANVQAAMEGE